jgi:hypothetical protein
MTRASLPNVDFTKIPREHEGSWVVVRLGEEQLVLAHARSPQEALRLSRIDPADPHYVLTQVPLAPGAARVAFSGGA